MRARWPVFWLAAAALSACATAPPPPKPEIIVYGGPPKDPRYQIPERFRDRHRLQREQWAGFQQQADQVHRLVASDPAFGGFILRWSPEPHAVVMFTGDAEARLRRYTSDPRFRAQKVELTLAELEAMKDAFGHQLARLGLTCFSVDGDEERNAVTVGAPRHELAKLRAAIAAGQVTAPRKLHLEEQGCPQLR